MEYGPTFDQHDSTAYRIQLCAQALCLEEMLQVTDPAGTVFDSETKRCEAVIFDDPLRQEVEHLAAFMHQILQSGKAPQAIYAKKCEGCSMKPVCLPSLVESASTSRYLDRAIGANLEHAPFECAIKDEEQIQRESSSMLCMSPFSMRTSAKMVKQSSFAPSVKRGFVCRFARLRAACASAWS